MHYSAIFKIEPIIFLRRILNIRPLITIVPLIRFLSFMVFMPHISSEVDNLRLRSDDLLLIFLLYSIMNLFLFSIEINLKNNKYVYLLFFLFFCCLKVFRRIDFFTFYLFFEISLIPLIILILSWGGYPERIKATNMLFFYTLFFSLPLLFILVIFLNSGNYYFYSNIFIFSHRINYLSVIIRVISTISFLVKLPIFGFHYWLPKAHVEAPIVGSIILAAVILKLGGLGIIIFIAFFNLNNLVTLFIINLGVLGGRLVSLICLIQVDMKILIAYSSITHIAFIIIYILNRTSNRMLCLLIIMRCHGFSSSGLFLCSHLLYKKNFSRNIIITKKEHLNIKHFSYLFLLFTMINIRVPLTSNIIGELIILLVVNKIVIFSYIPLFISLIFCVIYSLVLYISTNHGYYSRFNKEIHKFELHDITNLLIHFIYGQIILLIIFILWRDNLNKC